MKSDCECKRVNEVKQLIEEPVNGVIEGRTSEG
jgi:hypothetical protein